MIIEISVNSKLVMGEFICDKTIKISNVKPDSLYIDHEGISYAFYTDKGFLTGHYYKLGKYDSWIIRHEEKDIKHIQERIDKNTLIESNASIFNKEK